MKNLLKVVFVFAVITMMISSCTKEAQKCINKLEGNWNITKFEVTDSSGTTYDYVAIVAMMGGSFTGTVEFDKYDRNKEDYGTGRQATSIEVNGDIDNSNSNFEYALSEDCSTMTIIDLATNEEQEQTITELSKNSYELSGVDEEGQSFKVQIERQE